MIRKQPLKRKNLKAGVKASVHLQIPLVAAWFLALQMIMDLLGWKMQRQMQK